MKNREEQNHDSMKKAGLTALGILGTGALLFGACYYGSKSATKAILSSSVLNIKLDLDGYDIVEKPELED